MLEDFLKSLVLDCKETGCAPLEIPTSFLDSAASSNLSLVRGTIIGTTSDQLETKTFSVRRALSEILFEAVELETVVELAQIHF